MYFCEFCSEKTYCHLSSLIRHQSKYHPGQCRKYYRPVALKKALERQEYTRKMYEQGYIYEYNDGIYNKEEVIRLILNNLKVTSSDIINQQEYIDEIAKTMKRKEPVKLSVKKSS